MRFVPEMLVAMLADQSNSYIEQNKAGDRTWFAVGRGFEENILLKVFFTKVFTGMENWQVKPRIDQGKVPKLESTSC